MRRSAQDLIGYLVYHDCSIDCSPLGEVKIFFPGSSRIPLSDIEDAAAYLQEFNPDGSISVTAELDGICMILSPGVQE